MPSRRAVHTAALAGLAAALFAPPATSRAARAVTATYTPPTFGPDGEIRILCLGTSRTEGMGDTNPATGAPDWNGYRKPLLDLLRGPAAKHEAVMVGSQVDGSAHIPHEGWAGKTIPFLTQKVKDGALDNPGPTFHGPPHIVIVEAGINDAGAGHSPETMLGDMASLLREILAVSPNLRVVLNEDPGPSGLVNQTNSVSSLYLQAFNDGLPDLIASVDPNRISLVPAGAMAENGLFDGIHPGHAMYDLWARLIYRYGMAPWLGFRQKYMVSVPWPTPYVPRHL